MTQKHLITSALPYINGIKHLGNLVGSLLPADVYARFCRQMGRETLFICATDDHGTPAELAAAKTGQTPHDFCAEQHEIQKEIYENFGLSFDHFGATSRTPNHELTQHFAKKLFERGLIYVKETQQLYSHTDGRYLPDRYVEGTCPHCGYEKARGDQCENCTKVLDPTDLINPRSAISGSTELEVRNTKHLFLKQSALVDEIRGWVSERPDFNKLVKSIALKWLGEGLEDRGITRDLDWGVPVPTDVFGDDFAGKVFYVWFDAPIGYIAATREWAEETGGNWERWWREELESTRYTQFMAKDNIPFHTVSFPATQIGSGENWKSVDNIKGFNWLTYYGGKFSTSSQIGVFTDQALNELPADLWRYYLIARAPEGDDSAFTWPDLQAVVNKDLADVLGNFVNRTTSFTRKKFGEEGGTPSFPAAGDWTHEDEAFSADLQTRIERYTSYMDAIELRKAQHELREIWAAANGYLAELEPWSVYKTDPARAGAILNIALNFIGIAARLSAPIIPTLAADLAGILGEDTPTDWVTDVKTALTKYAGGTPFYPLPSVLMQKIEDEHVVALEEKFGGNLDKSV